MAEDQEEVGCVSCQAPQCWGAYQVRDYLTENEEFLRHYRGVGGDERPARITYPTVVRWAQEGKVFPNAHRESKTWAIPVSDLVDIESRLPIRGNPDWINGFPRKAKTNYVWGALPLELAQTLFAKEPYKLGSGEGPKEYALRLIRENIEDLPEAFRNPAKYPRIQLGKKLTGLAQQALEHVSPVT